MSELKFIAIFSLVPVAFFSTEIATFLAVLGLLVWLLFFVPKPDKVGRKTPTKGNSITDKNSEI